MNFIFISPHFPHTYEEFCVRLKENGVNVLGIADVPFDSLSPKLKGALTEYYRVSNMEDYDQMYRAVAFLAFRHGKIDWIESNNEYWLETDARLRTDFNVTSGIRNDQIKSIKEKSEMKLFYAKAGIPTARQIQASEGLERVRAFAAEVGYPLIAKPNVGVGAGDTHKIHSDEELVNFFSSTPESDKYVFEQYVTGDICSYDAIVDSNGEPLFESMTVCPPSIMAIVNKQLDLSYYVAKDVPDELRRLGRATVKAFGVTSRFVHLEFFRLLHDSGSLGNKGDFVALEVNMRPAGGYTPDMINFAHSADVYKIWADMIAYDRPTPGNGINPEVQDYYCVFASRRDAHSYAHSHDEIMDRYGDRMVMCERMPDIFAGAMGNQIYTIKATTVEEKDEFINFVHERQSLLCGGETNN